MPDIFLLSEAVLSQMSSEEEQKYRVFAQLRFIKHRDCSFNVCFVYISFTVHVSKILDQNTNT